MNSSVCFVDFALNVKSNVVERKTVEKFANIINDVSSPNFVPDIRKAPAAPSSPLLFGWQRDTRKVAENNYKFVPLNPECAKQRGNSRIAIRWLIQSRANAYWSRLCANWIVLNALLHHPYDDKRASTRGPTRGDFANLRKWRGAKMAVAWITRKR